MNFVDEKSDIAIQDISLDDKVAFLKKKENYPQTTNSVRAIKTHMSWVFLTDQFVYKLKIPFRYDHMRLLTSKARHHNCVQEVRLNKRLAEDFYVGVVPLSINAKGNMVLGGGKWPIDWLVKMKRLPEKKLLDFQIKENQSLSSEDLNLAVNLLTEFYIHADPVAISADQYQEKIISALKSYSNALCLAEYGLSENQVQKLHHQQLMFMEANTDLFKQRVQDGKIIEAHGDLKPDHICLAPPAVIDCLEFDESLRIMDVFDDLAFLSLECDRLEAAWVGDYFVRQYCNKSGDPFSKPLFNFYKSCKAYTRALLSIRHIREKEYQDDPKWKKRTEMYLQLTSKYLSEAL